MTKIHYAIKKRKAVIDMTKRLYITDLDGTLLNKESRISEKSKTILNRMIEKGIPITYATARSYASACKVTDGVNFSLPAIIYNGTFIYDIVGGKFLHGEYFTEENIADLMKLSQQFHFTPLIYTFVDGEEKIIYNKNGVLSDGFRYYLNRRRQDKRMLPVESLGESFQGKLFYVTFIENKEDLQPLYDILRKKDTFNSVFQQEIYRTEYWCEIMPNAVSKAKTAMRLKEFLPYDELVVFGDSLNDIPLFEIADYSYAVGNATDKLKRIATEVIGYNDEDGVAMKLSQLENW